MINILSNFIIKQKSKLRKLKDAQEGITLLEIAIVLIIIGLICASMFPRGSSCLEMAKLQTIQSQIQQYTNAIMLFRDRYGSLPGAFSQASEQFKDPYNQNGSGSHKITGPCFQSGSDSSLVWMHLAGSGILPMSYKKMLTGAFYPTISLEGGSVALLSDPRPDLEEGLYFVIGAKQGNSNDGALFTPAQAKYLEEKMENTYAMDAQNTKGNCKNLKYKGKACVVYVFIPF